MHTLHPRPLCQLHPLSETYLRSHLLTKDRTVRNPSGGDLEVEHPLSRLSTRELLSLPDDVTVHLAPGSLRASTSRLGVRNLLERFDTGMDTRSLIEFIRYAVDTEPRSSSVGAVTKWRAD